ncbi:MAG: hypothetical protein Rubg2KO_15210 [Rubricoccaceae bacterium]
MYTPPEPPNVVTGTFQELVYDAHGGDFKHELDHEVAQMIAATKLTGKKAKLVVTMEVSIDSTRQRVATGFTSKTTLPKPTRLEEMYYITDDGELVEEDPRQTKLDLAVVPEEKPTLETVPEQAPPPLATVENTEPTDG